LEHTTVFGTYYSILNNTTTMNGKEPSSDVMGGVGIIFWHTWEMHHQIWNILRYCFTNCTHYQCIYNLIPRNVQTLSIVFKIPPAHFMKLWTAHFCVAHSDIKLSQRLL